VISISTTLSPVFGKEHSSRILWAPLAVWFITTITLLPHDTFKLNKKLFLPSPLHLPFPLLTFQG
jgi:hypothetical protein